MKAGIIGLGRIGSAVGRRLQAFGMQVGFYDPFVPSGTEKVHGMTRYESLSQLVKDCRVISIHVPLSNSTRRMIGLAEFDLMSPETVLVNTARGEIIDQAVLIESVTSGRIGGVGLDVLEAEPAVPEALRSSRRVLLTAHSAFYSVASMHELRSKAALAVGDLLRGKSHRDIVNHVDPRHLTHLV